MIKTLMLSSALFLAACGNGAALSTGDYADAASTAVVIAQGGVELNPALSWAGDGAPVAALALKYVGKAALIEAGVPEDIANNTVGAVSWLGACNNILYLAGVAMPASLLGGAVCAYVAYNNSATEQNAL